jgi:cytochrome c-type biogenesis protein
MNGVAPSFGLAFLAGLASFLSPCVFALVPAYVGYLGGRSAASSANQIKSDTWNTVSHGFAFVIGFSIVFILLGLLSSVLGGLLYDFQWALSRIGGLIVIAFGVHLTGLFRIPFLDFDLRPQTQQQKNRSYFSSMLMGIFFSAGWSPCIGPILGAILTLAINGGSLWQGGLLLTSYSVGLAIPFLLAATQVSWVTFLVRRFGHISLWIERAMGVVLIILGVFLLSGRLSSLSSFGVFFDFLDEANVGVILFGSFIASLTIGLVVGWWNRSRGKNLIDGLLLGTGLSFFIFVFLFLIGALPFVG